MSHLVLARKFRPKTFDEVIGQPITLKILISSLKSKKIHQAYLFSGTRGVGKTTLARLLAKALSCKEGITHTPCNVCEPCLAIDAGNFVDLIEIDAATRTKVEQTRELLENVQYLPVQGRYKIYLIDEVHMLSTHSFNALLKTLEEPPSYVKFLFATTEPDKIPDTILSRCLPFYLKPVTQKDITQHLEKVLTIEKIEAEKQALAYLAVAAKGSLRDSLSLLEQAIGLSDQNKLTTKQVQDLLGFFDPSQLIKLLDCILTAKTQQALELVCLFEESGAQFESILTQLLQLLHQLLVRKVFSDKSEECLDALAQKIDSEQIHQYFQIIVETKRDFDLMPDAKLGFEMLVLRLIAFKPIHLPELIFTQADEKPHQPISKTIFDWPAVYPKLKLEGFAKQLAEKCHFIKKIGNQIFFRLEAQHHPFMTERHIEKIQAALSDYCLEKVTLKIEIDKIRPQKVIEKQQDLKKQVESNQTVKTLVDNFGATVIHIEEKVK